MRLASMLLIAACLSLSAHADGKPRQARTADSAPAMTAPAPLERQAERRSPAKATPIGHETEIYRFGGTYSVNPGTTASACEITCGEDMACKAWSFVDAYGSSAARCELKRSAGRSEENLLATSGLSPALKARFLGAPAPRDDIDRDQFLSDASAAPLDIQLLASVPVLTYVPVSPPIAAPDTQAGVQLPLPQPTITFSPVMLTDAPAALRYAPPPRGLTMASAPAN